MKNDIVQVKLKIEIPKTKWLATFNEKFPSFSFNILSKFLLDQNTGNTLIQIKGTPIERFLKEFELKSKPPTYQILFKGKDLLILNVKTKDPWILNALIKTEMLINYPIKIKKGNIHIEAITERLKVDKFLSELERHKIFYSIVSIGYYRPSALLTERQEEILRYAYDKGYFEVPRKISLTKLSIELKISPSALSEMLRRINRRLTKDFLI